MTDKGKAKVEEEYLEPEELAYDYWVDCEIRTQILRLKCLRMEPGEDLFHYRQRLRLIKADVDALFEVQDKKWKQEKAYRKRKREEERMGGENKDVEDATSIFFTPNNGYGSSSGMIGRTPYDCNSIKASRRLSLEEWDKEMERREKERKIEEERKEEEDPSEEDPSEEDPYGEGYVVASDNDGGVEMVTPGVGGVGSDESDDDFEMWEVKPPTPLIIEISDSSDEDRGFGTDNEFDFDDSSDDSGDSSDDPDFDASRYDQRKDVADAYYI